MRRSLSFWESVPLPIELYLGFLRRLAPIDKDYGRWRPKDWKLFADVPGIFQFGGGYCDIAFGLVRDNPHLGIPAIRPWLNDESRLVGGEARSPMSQWESSIA